MANLYAELFGAAARTGAPETTVPLRPAAIQRRIEAEAVRQGVPPALALAVARQESGLNPHAVGDNGNSLGLFQLQRAAAIDAGIDPARRGEVDFNIEGGVRYLKQKLNQSGGNVEQALSRYNRGTPTYRGIGDPHYVEHVLAKIEPGAPRQGLLQRVGRALSPASAEAAPPVARSGQTVSRAPDPGGRGKQLLDTLFGPAPTAPTAVAPAETFPPLAEQEAASTQKALTGTLPPGYDPSTGQGPAPAPPPPGSGTRLLEVITGQPATPPAPAAPAGPPTAATQVDLLQQQEAGRLQAEREVGSPTRPAPTREDWLKAAAATGISVGLSVLGAAGGTYVLPGYGTVAGEMAGSYAARKINVALGLEAPGFTGDVASMVLPPAGRALVPAVKWGVRHLPGAQGVLHTDVATRLAGQAENLLPATPSAQIYQQVAQGTNPRIATRNLWRTAHELIRDEMRLQPAMRNQELVRVAHDVFAMAQPGLGNVPMSQLYANQQRVGEMIRTARRSAGSQERGLRRLYGAFHADLEAAAAQGIPEAATLRTAIAASRREHAVDELQELFMPGRPGITVRPDGQVEINAGRLRTRLRDQLQNDQVFRQSFQPEELREIEQILLEAQRLKRVPPPKGATFGSGTFARRSGTAAAVTMAITQDPALATTMGLIAAGGPELLSWGLQTAPGRAIVRRALRDGHSLTDPMTLMSLFMASRPATSAAATDVAGALAPGE